jgi:hypothetical protein
MVTLKVKITLKVTVTRDDNSSTTLTFTAIRHYGNEEFRLFAATTNTRTFKTLISQNEFNFGVNSKMITIATFS